MHLHAQHAPGRRAEKGPLSILDIVQDGEATAIIGLTIERWANCSRGALEQAHAEPQFQLPNDLAGCRSRQVKILGRPGEAAPIYNPHEKAHRINPVHGASIVPIFRTVMPFLATLSRLLQRLYAVSPLADLTISGENR